MRRRNRENLRRSLDDHDIAGRESLDDPLRLAVDVDPVTDRDGAWQRDILAVLRLASEVNEFALGPIHHRALRHAITLGRGALSTTTRTNWPGRNEASGFGSSARASNEPVCVFTRGSTNASLPFCGTTVPSDRRTVIVAALMSLAFAATALPLPIRAQHQALFRFRHAEIDVERIDLRDRRQQAVLPGRQERAFRLQGAARQPGDWCGDRRIAEVQPRLGEPRLRLLHRGCAGFGVRDRFVVFALTQRLAAGERLDAFEVAARLRELRLRARWSASAACNCAAYGFGSITNSSWPAHRAAFLVCAALEDALHARANLGFLGTGRLPHKLKADRHGDRLHRLNRHERRWESSGMPCP